MPSPRKSRNNQQGYVLFTIALSAVAMFGVAGLAVDLGRMYIVRNELQAFSDSAALSASLRLNGESTGISRAREEINTIASANRWDFGTTAVDAESMKVEFGYSVNGSAPTTWTASPPSPPTDYSFTRITARVAVPVHFMPVVTGRRTSYVSAVSTAGQLGSSTPGQMFPFTPVAHSRTGPNFGLTAGRQYTLRWPASPNRINMNNICEGDRNLRIIDLADSRGAENRGFYGGQASASEVWDQVANDAPVQQFQIGDQIVLSGGAKTTVKDALVTRINSDSDSTSATFDAYRDRGRTRRLTTIPITDAAAGNEILGYGRFFLLPAQHYATAQGNDPWCAIYIGPGAPEGSDSKGASPSAGPFTKVRLWE